MGPVPGDRPSLPAVTGTPDIWSHCSRSQRAEGKDRRFRLSWLSSLLQFRIPCIGMVPFIVGGVPHSDEGNQDHLPQTIPQVNLIYSALYGDSLENLDSVKLTNKADHCAT